MYVLHEIISHPNLKPHICRFTFVIHEHVQQNSTLCSFIMKQITCSTNVESSQINQVHIIILPVV